MGKSIILSSKKNKNSVDENILLNEEINTTFNKLPVGNIESTLDQYQQYIKEKDKSNKYRFVFTINPICSNVLFNRITEIVKNEGGNGCIYVKKSNLLNGIKTSSAEAYNYLTNYKGYTDGTSISKDEFIKDTAFSHDSIGGYEYHCGLDIFTNHRFRGKYNYAIINPLKSDETNKNFNTYLDDMRDYNGDAIKQIERKDTGIAKEHIYTKDTLITMYQSINNNLIERNGWFGFINKATTEHDNASTKEKGYESRLYGKITINKILCNKSTCEFVDMYPDRTLFSFIPKYNKYRKRNEKNWDYLLTYPYTSTKNNNLIHKNIQNKDIYGIRAVFINELSNTRITDGADLPKSGQIFINTSISNNLKPGDRVKILVVDSETYYEVHNTIKVINTGIAGSNTTTTFSVSAEEIIGYVESLTMCDVVLYVSKVVKGLSCEYYVRKFKAIPNINNQNGDFNSNINRLGFCNNIYGDTITQIVYNDTIDVSDLRDNLGRELSEIYLTIIKRNRGYSEWYGGSPGSDTVEFSHCFGPVSSGFDIIDTTLNEYNIHRIHNVSKKIVEAVNLTVSDSALENNITVDSYDFYGDIVELDVANMKETILEDVQHRFNTYQREYSLTNSFGNKVQDDEIVKDDFWTDMKNSINDDVFQNPFEITEGVSQQSTKKNSPKTYATTSLEDYFFKGYDDFEGNTSDYFTGSTISENGSSNIAPEGYFYKAHYRIPLREFSETINEGYDILLTFTANTSNTSITTDKNYYFNVGDEIFAYNKKTNEKKIYFVKGVSGETFNVIGLNTTITDRNNYVFFKPNPEKPDGAYRLENTSGKYIWREFKKTEEIMMDDELYDQTFTNGATYIHKNINFLLKRQDPYGIYNMSFKNSTNSKLQSAEVYGKYKDIENGIYFAKGENTLC